MVFRILSEYDGALYTANVERDPKVAQRMIDDNRKTGELCEWHALNTRTRYLIYSHNPKKDTFEYKSKAEMMTDILNDPKVRLTAFGKNMVGKIDSGDARLS